MYRNLEIIERIKVEGTTKNWEVCKLEDGTYTCNCPAWIFHKGQKVDCKHIIGLKSQLNLIVQEVKNV